MGRPHSGARRDVGRASTAMVAGAGRAAAQQPRLPSHFSITYEALPARGWGRDAQPSTFLTPRQGESARWPVMGRRTLLRVEVALVRLGEKAYGGTGGGWRRITAAEVIVGLDECGTRRKTRRLQTRGRYDAASVDHCTSSVQRKRRYSHPTLPSLSSNVTAQAVHSP